MSEPRRLNVRSARQAPPAGQPAGAQTVSPPQAAQPVASGMPAAQAASRQGNTAARRINTRPRQSVPAQPQAAQPAPAQTPRQAAAAVSGARAVSTAARRSEDEALRAAQQRLARQRSISYQGYEAQAQQQASRPARRAYDVNDDPDYAARQQRRASRPATAPSSRASAAQAAADALSFHVTQEQPAVKEPPRAQAQNAARSQPQARAGAAGGNGGRGGSASGGRGGAQPGGKGRKKKMRWWQVLLATVLVLAVIFGGTFALIMNALKPQTGGNITLNQLLNTPKEYSGKEINVLLVGVDRSSGDSTEDREVNDGLTDMIMYLHFNNETGEIKMLQIPRNIFVTTDASYSGNYQINAIAKTQGASGYNDVNALCEYISNAFGLYIDGYITIRMEKLTELVDILGGIQLYVPQDMNDGLSHLSQGYQTLDGAACEFFLRARHIYADSDLGRLDTQRYFYAAMFARLRSMTAWDIAKNFPFYLSMVETSLDASDLISVAVSLLKISSDHIMLAQVPVYMGGDLNYPFNVEHPQNVVVVARQETADLLNSYFRENSGPVEASELNVKDDVHNVSGRTTNNSNVQWMGDINREAAEAQANNNIDGSVTTDVYDVTDPTPDPESGADGDAEPAA